jgi:hypothetical protein
MAGLILEISPYITAVKIFTCLDLEQNNSFLDGHSLMQRKMGALKIGFEVVPSIN